MRLQVDERMERKRAKNAILKEKITGYWGKEPNLSDWSLTFDIFQQNFIRALAWYNNSLTLEQMKRYALTYLKENNTSADRMRVYEAAEDRDYNTVGSLCRMFSLGISVPESYLPYLKKKLDSMLASAYSNGKKILAKQTEEESSKYAKIQESVKSRKRFLLGLVENEVDRHILGGNPNFSMREFLFEREIAPIYVSAIRERYEKLLSEIKSALSGDVELKEAYSNFKKPALLALRDFLQNIVEECGAFVSETRQQNKIQKLRKPRKKKEKTVEKIVGKIQYKTSIPELKIVSVSPEKIIKSESIWLFDAKYRYLTHLVAKPTGFVVRGTTIFDYDEAQSERKKLRKPEQILPAIVNEGKVYLRRVMGTIKSRPQKVTGRLNSDTVILRAE